MNMYAMRLIYLVVCIVMTPMQLVNGQTSITLSNASFEVSPGIGMVGGPSIWMWEDCGAIRFPRESPPDILPTAQHAWGVTTTAHDGDYYLSMVTRYNATWESVSQILRDYLLNQQCYELDIALCLSPVYVSGTRRMLPMDTTTSRTTIGKRSKVRELDDETIKAIIIEHIKNGDVQRLEPPVKKEDTAAATGSALTESFAHPVVLRLWGGVDFCDRAQLLATTPPIDHHEWQQYALTFKAMSNLKYITIEAYHADDTAEPYYGHVLVDGMSSIREITCGK